MSSTHIAHARVALAADGRIFLRPRPLGTTPGAFLLLPLLPTSPTPKQLPEDVWAVVLDHLVMQDGGRGVDEHPARPFALVNKGFKDILLPMLYAHVYIRTARMLHLLTSHLVESQRHWNSFRSMPYSAPGRWVKVFDLSSLPVIPIDGFFHSVNDALAQACPLLPFLESLSLPDKLALSARTLYALALRDGAAHLRRLVGLRVVPSTETAFLALLHSASGIRELAVCPDSTDADTISTDAEDNPPMTTLVLPALNTLAVAAPLPPSLQRAFMDARLPALVNATFAPCAELPALLDAHGAGLQRLLLDAHVPAWPAHPAPSPPDILVRCPALMYLALPTRPTPLAVPHLAHPLHEVRIARPDDALLAGLVRLRAAGALPALREVRVLGVRYVGAKLGARACQAGVQGTLRVWRTKLARGGVRLLDCDGAEAGQGEERPRSGW